MDLEKLEQEMFNANEEMDRTCVAYNLVDEILSRIENVFKDIRNDYWEEYNDAQDAYCKAKDAFND